MRSALTAAIAALLFGVVPSAAAQPATTVPSEGTQPRQELQAELREVELAMLETRDSAQRESLNRRRAAIIAQLEQPEQLPEQPQQPEPAVAAQVVEPPAAAGTQTRTGLSSRLMLAGLAGMLGIGLIGLAIGHGVLAMAIDQPRSRRWRAQVDLPLLALGALVAAAVGVGVALAPIVTLVAVVILFGVVVVAVPRR